MTISQTTLKNAARAIEHDLWTDSDGANYLVKDGAILRRWEPEHDDGDSLRLAVAINEVRCFIYPEEVSMGTLGIVVPHDGDPMPAVRTAILLAAAQIGAAL